MKKLTPKFYDIILGCNIIQMDNVFTIHQILQMLFNLISMLKIFPQSETYIITPHNHCVDEKVGQFVKFQGQCGRKHFEQNHNIRINT
jgi:hypothetical protein